MQSRKSLLEGVPMPAQEQRDGTAMPKSEEIWGFREEIWGFREETWGFSESEPREGQVGRNTAVSGMPSISARDVEFIPNPSYLGGGQNP